MGGRKADAGNFFDVSKRLLQEKVCQHSTARSQKVNMSFLYPAALMFRGVGGVALPFRRGEASFGACALSDFS